MKIKRHFLKPAGSLLEAAAEFLLDRHVLEQKLALSNVVLVLPGRRAGRRLLEILLERTAQRNLAVEPPTIATMGALPELLYAPQRPFASDIVQRLAWSRALQETDRQRVERVFPQLPADDATDQWLLLGTTLWRLHRELTADDRDFADVALMGETIPGFTETERWKILRRVQENYLRLLDELDLWDIQTARLHAIEHHECATERQIVLIGTVDMNRALRRMLDQVADHVTALIFAPKDWAKRFDEHGCLAPPAWQEIEIDLDERQIQVTEDANAQAESALRRMAEYDGKYHADDITIGVPDQQLVPLLQQHLGEHGIKARWLIGKTLPETAPYRLLAALRDLTATQRFEDWAALVRHPAIFRWLQEQGIQGDWLTRLDEYHNEHLPPHLGGTWLGRVQDRVQLERIQAAIQSLLAPLLGSDRKPLDTWTQPLLQIFQTVYGSQALDREQASDHFTISACQKIASTLQAQQTLPARVVPPATAVEAIDLLLEQLDQEAVPSPSDPHAVELLGWLELPLDDAPALIVTSFNEGFVPTSTRGDLFLPDSLRQCLELDDNRRRYARDAYALEILKRTREDLLLLVGRRDGEGNPLTPSRLLFAAPQATIAQRVLHFCQPEDTAAERPLPPGKFVATRNDSTFDVPPTQPPEPPVSSLRVTAFKDYLACPYRFYLNHVLKLQPLDDTAEELDALVFGTLIHDVLHAFGESELKDSVHTESIQTFLIDRLYHNATRQFGPSRRAAVNVQLRQIQARLEAFAAWQADWRNQGWRIAFTEQPRRGDDPIPFDVDGEPMLLRGRIDRIDTNDQGDWCVLDYKSSNNATRPEKAHKTSGEWVDLQLPLYRHIAATLGVTGNAQFGYIALPKDVTQTRCLLAEWTEADFEDADEVARNVVRCIRRGEFWPPAETPKYAEAYAPICMDAVFEPPRYARVEEGARR